MRTFAVIGLFAGLAAAGLVAIEPREQAEEFYPVTGPRCCGEATEDLGGHCKAAGMSAFCCSRFHNGRGQGCDQAKGFKTGRNIKMARLDTMSSCNSGGMNGFVGCI
ncbi:hypothetical protein PspLS_09309 [Pyricularia sp. CBS 133598]|nr:hypothetical protein PspLS_09309 [Pyricularia sp. CBS 133598]